MGDESSGASSPAPPPTTLSLVIPAFEEEARLPGLLEVLADRAAPAIATAGMDLVEILIVDDGSADRTREMLVAATAGDARLKPILDIERNRGKGAAIATGVAHASGDYVLLADVDLSTPLEELPKLTAAIEEGADLAIGSRAIAGAVVERGPLHRKLLGKTFNASVRLLTGLAVRDTQCGFKLMPTRVARRVLLHQTCPGFAFDVELLMKARGEGMRIAEVPVLYLHDSRSRVRVVRASIEMLRDVAGLAYRLRMRRRPARAPHPPRLTRVPADDPD